MKTFPEGLHFLLLMSLLLLGCTSNYVVIPQSDSTPPTLNMRISDNYGTNIDFDETQAPLTMMGGSTDLSIIATAYDEDGGLKSVKLQATALKLNSNALVGSSTGPITYEEVVSNAQVGESARGSQLVAHTFDLSALRGNWDSVELNVWIEAENFHGGITQSAVFTILYPAIQAGDTPYMAECRRLNVPMPPDFDIAGFHINTEWVEQGDLQTNMFAPGGEATIWTYSGSRLRGACMAIGREELFAVICQSAITGYACFWEAFDENGDNLDWHDPSNRPFVIAEMGDETTLGEDFCTVCHRGNNAFLMAPDDPVWASVMRGPLASNPGSTWTTNVEWSSDIQNGHPRFIPVSLSTGYSSENPYIVGAPGCTTCHENPTYDHDHTLTFPPMPPDCASVSVADCYATP